VAESGLVIVDKSGGMTSHDVVARIRRLAGTRRVGHAGTLDPMATGVLVIGVEKATRLLGYLTLTEKEYDGTIRLGQATVTDDAEGEVLPPAEGFDADATTLSEAELRSALDTFVGQISQVPPRISAVKVDGERAYRLTRSGAAPELTARPVTITRLDLLAIRVAGPRLLDLDVSVTCSSGTYIRAIARDLGTALRTGGHLTALRRTRVGPYGIARARTLEQLAENYEFTPLAEAAAAAFGCIHLSAEEARLVSHGARLPASAGRLGPGSTGAGSEGPRSESARGGGPSSQGNHGSGGEGLCSEGRGSEGRGSEGPGNEDDESVGPARSAAGGEAGLGSGVSVARPDEAGLASGVPVAAFDPDGSLTALLVREGDEMRPLAVFVP
jgi:tRNA pseudouridine55 synthase